jgi:hypothetical protein
VIAHHLVLAAPGAVEGITGGQVLGTVTYSALAATAAICLIAGLRGSDRVKLNTRDRAGAFAIVTGTLLVAAGGAWTQIANSLGDGAAGAFSDTSGLGDFGQGGTSLALTALTFVPKWRKLLIPAVLGIAAAVTFHTAGGTWGLIIKAILTPAGIITGTTG